MFEREVNEIGGKTVEGDCCMSFLFSISGNFFQSQVFIFIIRGFLGFIRSYLASLKLCPCHSYFLNAFSLLNTHTHCIILLPYRSSINSALNPPYIGLNRIEKKSSVD